MICWIVLGFVMDLWEFIGFLLFLALLLDDFLDISLEGL